MPSDTQELVQDRIQAYGHPRDNFAAIADGWVWYLQHKFGIRVPLDADDVPGMMRIVKEARLLNGYHRDTLDDIAGYAETQHMLRDPAPKEIEWNPPESS